LTTLLTPWIESAWGFKTVFLIAGLAGGLASLSWLGVDAESDAAGS
jgi:hypothetical protein